MSIIDTLLILCPFSLPLNFTVLFDNGNTIAQCIHYIIDLDDDDYIDTVKTMNELSEFV